MTGTIIALLIGLLFGFFLGCLFVLYHTKAKPKPNKTTVDNYPSLAPAVLQDKVSLDIIQLQDIIETYKNVDVCPMKDEEQVRHKKSLSAIFDIQYRDVHRSISTLENLLVVEGNVEDANRRLGILADQLGEVEKCMTEFRSLSAQ